MKKLIYIAAPYTHPDPVENTNKVIRIAEEVIKAGYIPYIPHLNLLWHLIAPHPGAFWYAYDLQILRRCDAILRIDGVSKGADMEVQFAKDNNIPVIYGIDDLINWPQWISDE